MKSVLVIGLGRFGRHLSRKFIEEGNAVLAIEKDETRADWAVNIVNEIQIGDATNEDFIKSLGVNNFDICVVAVGDNFQTALEITVLLKDFGAEYKLPERVVMFTVNYYFAMELIMLFMQNGKLLKK